MSALKKDNRLHSWSRLVDIAADKWNRNVSYDAAQDELDHACQQYKEACAAHMAACKEVEFYSGWRAFFKRTDVYHERRRKTLEIQVAASDRMMLAHDRVRNTLGMTA